MNAVTEIPADVMRGYVAAFGQQCIDIARELAAQGDLDAQELLDKLEQSQVSGEAA